MAMEEVYLHRNFLCIDLKSFFAFVECIDKNVDAFTYPLVVANKNQGKGAITLAVSPYLKEKGVPSRGRLYEIPKDIHYEIARPRMHRYLEKSREVIEIYLKYVSKDDLHIYSIDECFLDVIDYLKKKKKTDYELALDILRDVKKSTGLVATCGIGPNMLLAKLSMDIEAKHNKDFIAKWTYEDIPNKLWPIEPLSKVWGIGSRMEKNLNKLGIYSMGDLAHYDRNKLKQKFGVIGMELWNHANGIDLSRIKDMSKDIDKSYSHSQVLFKDYDGTNIKIIIREMVEVVVIRLHKNNKTSSLIGLGIGYSKGIGGGFFHQIKLSNPTDSEKIILDNALMIFDKYYEDLPIRKVTIACGHLANKDGVQLNLFDNIKEIEEQEQIDKAILEIKDKFGKNALLKASSLLNDSTIHERNKKIGGHSA